MADPLVVQLANEFREQLRAREAASVSEMARRWLAVEQALEQQVVALALELAAQREAGQAISRSKVFRLQRYQLLLLQVQDELRRFNAFAEGRIDMETLQNTVQGFQNAAELIGAAALPQPLPGGGGQDGQVEITFNRLGIEAAETVAAIARAGQPLGRILERSYPLAVEALTNKLVNGIAQGINPREVARQAVAEGLSEGLNHILLVARDQGNRSYREASRQQYQQSGVVTGYMRLAAKGPKQIGRTCLACLALDGTVYKTDEFMAVHAGDRCSMVPIVAGFKPVTWQSGEAYFKSLPRDVQAEWMGPGRWELWKTGQFEFGRLAKIVENDTWGPSAQVRPVAELMR